MIKPHRLPNDLQCAIDLAADDRRVRSFRQLQALLAELAPEEFADRPAPEHAEAADRATRVAQLAERLERGQSLWNDADTVWMREATGCRANRIGREPR